MEVQGGRVARVNMKRQIDPYGNQGDEEVNKKIKQNNIYLNKLPNISI